MEFRCHLVDRTQDPIKNSRKFIIHGKSSQHEFPFPFPSPFSSTLGPFPYPFSSTPGKGSQQLADFSHAFYGSFASALAIPLVQALLFSSLPALFKSLFPLADPFLILLNLRILKISTQNTKHASLALHLSLSLSVSLALSPSLSLPCSLSLFLPLPLVLSLSLSLSHFSPSLLISFSVSLSYSLKRLQKLHIINSGFATRCSNEQSSRCSIVLHISLPAPIIPISSSGSSPSLTCCWHLLHRFFRLVHSSLHAGQ